jgi:hypothetical protein
VLCSGNKVFLKEASHDSFIQTPAPVRQHRPASRLRLSG